MMADLYELLAPYFDKPPYPSDSLPIVSILSPKDAATTSYLSRLTTLSLSDLASTESASLLQSAQWHIRNLQALSKRSHKAVIASSSHLTDLASLLPALGKQADELNEEIPELETVATDFARKYDRSTENAVLDRRKRAMLLSRNVDRVSDVLDLPTLVSSTVSAAQTSSTSTSSMATSYASALDLHAHIKRFNALYPQSELVAGISKQAEAEIQNLTSILITSLQSQNLKLAAAMRTIGWLRRVAPDLADDGYTAAKPPSLSTRILNLSSNTASPDGALESLFLVCRLRTLHQTLGALEPLRDLADQETTRRKQGTHAKLIAQGVQMSSLGSQSERYLKRYIEIFREQSFNIISMYKSIFPSGLPNPEGGNDESSNGSADPLLLLPSALTSFALHLVDMLTDTLRAYMPNVADRQSRESLLTQVLYCAGSLGRQGADFGMMIALLEEELNVEAVHEAVHGEPEWVQVMQKHRVQASRLEVLARGVGSGPKSSMDVQSPAALSAG